jgi:hypothetical protein
MVTVRVIMVDTNSQGSGTITVNADSTLNVYWCRLQSGSCIAGVTTTIKKVLTPYDAQAQPVWYEGIWQQDGSPNSYYALHVEGDEIVLVDFASLERTGQALTAAYRGKWSVDASGSAMASLRTVTPHPLVSDRADLSVNADKTLTISRCNTANGCVIGTYTTIRKVF